ncbi:hypothetical protein KOW79_017115 [Hemibagrus wyckioides]|uniref:Uncharacterized protein n=1 Tax=Hemibagrus wyckioides TaxID=337641 RepID=A0A9D3SDD4_9TELE|nr:hypothetical protein KOW79_017115 [Hemibagrus wyckioides]
MINPPHCSTASIIQQQNQTPLPPSSIHLADVTVQPCGQPETSGKVQQDQKKPRGFPEGKSPLDPLSVSPVKLKRNQKERQRRPKGSQKRRAGAGSLQVTSGQNATFTEIRSGQSASVDPTEKSNNNTSSSQQHLETSGVSSPNTQKNPSGKTRTSKPGSRTGFNLPIDRIGLGRLPSGRR